MDQITQLASGFADAKGEPDLALALTVLVLLLAIPRLENASLPSDPPEAWSDQLLRLWWVLCFCRRPIGLARRVLCSSWLLILPCLFLSSPRPLVSAGNFSGPKRHEFAVSRGHVLELIRPDESGRLHVVFSTEVFGLIRSLLRYRLHGQEFDHLVVASDSGRITVLRYEDAKGAFTVVQRETYGKTGCRRATAGQFLAGDPRGRAFMVAAIEKQKFVYQTNREEDLLTMSSPLDAHKSATITFDCCGLDNGFDNPVFAALELEYGEADQDPSGEAAAAAAKMLVHYELDLGLNTVTRRYAKETDRGANALLAVPGGTALSSSSASAASAAAAAASPLDGPGGVLVLAENWVIFEHPLLPGDRPGECGSLRAPIPRRADMPDERGLLLTAGYIHKQKPGLFFAIVQSELGDLYKVSLTYGQKDPSTGQYPKDKDGKENACLVTDLTVQYFDTIPPASALTVGKNGLLFSASEGGNHYLYRFVSLGENDHEAATSKAIKMPSLAGLDEEAAAAAAAAVEVVCPVFAPRPLTNLAKIDELSSLHPLMDAKLVLPPAIHQAALAVGVGGPTGSSGVSAPGALAAAAAAAAAASSSSSSGFGAASSSTSSLSSAPYIAALCGKGPRSSLKLLREGLPVTEVASTALPGEPTAIFTVKQGGGGASASSSSSAAAADEAAASSDASSSKDKYIVISFSNATMALAVGEAVEEVSATETGLLYTAPTLAVQLLANDALLQVHPNGMRLITSAAPAAGSGAGGSGGAQEAAGAAGAPKKVQEWRAPGKRTVLKACTNPRQVILYLSGGELVYFELDAHGRLDEVARKSLVAASAAGAAGGAAPAASGEAVTALAIAQQIPHGKLRVPFFAFSDSSNMVRLMSLDPATPLQQASAQALRASCTSLAMVYLSGSGSDSPSALASPHLFIGLSSGVLTRVLVDPSTGVLSDPRTRFLGPKPVKLQVISSGVGAESGPGVVALSARPWLTYCAPGSGIATGGGSGASSSKESGSKLLVSPLSYGSLTAASSFSSDMLPAGGVVALSGENLKILMIERFGEAFHSISLPLRYTPRRMALHPRPAPPTALLPYGVQLACIIESDHNTTGIIEREKQRLAALAAASSSSDSSSSAPAAAPITIENGSGSMEMDEQDDDGDAMDMEEEGGGAGRSSSSSSSSSSSVPAVKPQQEQAQQHPPGSGLKPGDTLYAIAKPSVATPGMVSTAAVPAELAPAFDPQSGTALVAADGSAGAAETALDVRRVGASPPSTSQGSWGSCIRLVDLAALSAGEEAYALPSHLTTHHPSVHHLVELEENEAAISCAFLNFQGHSEQEFFVVVGTVTGMAYHPRAFTSCALRTYRIVQMAGVPVDAQGVEVEPGSPRAVGTRQAYRLQFLHCTPVEDVPYALQPTSLIGGRLLAGVGRTLRLYELGKKKLLRKGEARGFPSLIASIHVAPSSMTPPSSTPSGPSLSAATLNDRVFVGDASESIHVLKYRKTDHSFVLLADDVVTSRHVTSHNSVVPLDSDTIAAGDKFGNVFILRMPVDGSVDEDAVDTGLATGERLLWNTGAGGIGGAMGAAGGVGGAPYKLQQVAQFYVGEAVTSITKAALAGGAEILLYATIGGTIGALLPFSSRDDLDFFTHLELFLRAEGGALSLVGRDHLSYRSYFIPTKVSAKKGEAGSSVSALVVIFHHLGCLFLSSCLLLLFFPPAGCRRRRSVRSLRLPALRAAKGHRSRP